MQTGKQMIMNHLDIKLLDKVDKGAVIIYVRVPSGSNIRKKEQQKLEIHQGLTMVGEHIGTE